MRLLKKPRGGNDCSAAVMMAVRVGRSWGAGLASSPEALLQATEPLLEATQVLVGPVLTEDTVGRRRKVLLKSETPYKNFSVSTGLC